MDDSWELAEVLEWVRDFGVATPRAHLHFDEVAAQTDCFAGSSCECVPEGSRLTMELVEHCLARDLVALCCCE